MTTPTHTDIVRPTPGEAWQRLLEGNARFVAGHRVAPSQDAVRRVALAEEQHPYAVIFGCSDSRVAAEIIFDQGLGDLFVVRNAGHVLDTTTVGSIEYGIDVLSAPLVVVLGHDRCGARAAATEALLTGRTAGGFVRAVVDRVIPALLTHAELAGAAANAVGGGRTVADPDTRGLQLPDDDSLRHEHVRSSVQMLRDYSASVAAAVDQGRVAVVGAEYTLSDGRIQLVDHMGALGG